MNENCPAGQHYGLTEKQYYALCVIQELTAAKGFAPSLSEIGHELDIKCRSGVHFLVKGLIERGYVAQIARRGRTLRVLRPVALPDFGDAADSTPTPDFTPTLYSTPTPALPHQGGGGENAGKPG